MDIVTFYHMFMGSAIGVFLLQYLKNAKWFPWAQTAGTKYVNRAMAIIIAILSATGIGHVWDPAAHTLMFTNLTVGGIAIALWHWLQQFIMQETVYQATANKAASQMAHVGSVGTIEGQKKP